MIALSKIQFAASGLDHPEGLAFDANGNLYSGGELGQIYRIDQAGNVEEICRTGGFTLGMTIGPDGNLYVCNFELSAVIKVQPNGEWSIFAEYAGDIKIRVPNVPVFDRQGNLYVSDSGDWKGNNGVIYRFDLNGKGEVFCEGPFEFTNGLAFSPNEDVLYVVESTKDRIKQIEIKNGKAGAISLLTDGIYHVPDGVFADEDGILYVTCFASNRIYRIQPDGSHEILLWDEDAKALQAPTNCLVRREGGQKVLYYANLNGSFIGKVVLEDD